METGFCERGHQVWWARIADEPVAFIRLKRAFRFGCLPETGPRDRVVAYPLAHVYRLHSDVCDSIRFRPTKRERT